MQNVWKKYGETQKIVYSCIYSLQKQKKLDIRISRRINRRHPRKFIKENKLKHKRERGDLITIKKLINSLEETNRKDQIIKRAGEAKYLKGHKITFKKKYSLEWHNKVQLSLPKYRDLKWSERKDDNGKKCTTNKRKTGYILIRRQGHTRLAQALYTTSL